MSTRLSAAAVPANRSLKASDDPRRSNKPRQQVADVIAARIAAGRYARKLPSELDLATEFGGSYVTVRRAMAVLREHKLIVSIHGKNTFTLPESAGNQSQTAPNYQEGSPFRQ